jgi:hypothetical protein
MRCHSGWTSLPAIITERPGAEILDGLTLIVIGSVILFEHLIA